MTVRWASPEATEEWEFLPIRRTETHSLSATGYRLFRRAWVPKSPERVVVLVHGYAEHSGRYEHVATHLVGAGCVVHAYDQQGHGRSEGIRCHVRRFEDLLDDLEGVVADVRSQHIGLPLFIVGHSLGGLVVAALARERQPDVTGVATSAACLTVSSELLRGRARIVRILSRLIPRTAFESGLAPDALCRDPEVVRAYLEDPLVCRKMTTLLAAEILRAIERTAGGGAEIGLPMLLLHGEEDSICPARASREFFEQLVVPGKQLHVYARLRHEIFNEPERDEVLADLVNWMRSIDSDSKEREAS